VYMDGSERHQPMLCTTTIEDADLKECLHNMGHTQVVERWCKVPRAAAVHHKHEVRYLGH